MPWYTVFNRSSKSTPEEPTYKAGIIEIPTIRDTTTKRIAYSLLYAYLLALAVLFVINYSAFQYGEPRASILPADEDMRKSWFDLLRNGIVLLGTALTTVIGYYFGQREGAAKIAEAERKEQQIEGKRENVERETEATVTSLSQLTDQAAQAVKAQSQGSDAVESNQPSANEGAPGIELPN